MSDWNVDDLIGPAESEPKKAQSFRDAYASVIDVVAKYVRLQDDYDQEMNKLTMHLSPAVIVDLEAAVFADEWAELSNQNQEAA
jgi:hypothetical protein